MTPDSLTGLVLAPGDPGYDDARLEYNAALPPTQPRYIDFCQAEPDVQRAVRFARGHGFPIRARSGRHSYEGYSVVTGGVIADVSPIDHVVLDPKTGLARVGAGAALLDVYQKLWEQGRVTIPAGSCPTVGVAGLTLGGGFGVLSRLLGLTCDALDSLRMVDARGDLLVVSPGACRDLFWASCGGGGGNFGVVTEFTFRTTAVGDVTIVYLKWPWSEIRDVFEAFQIWADPFTLDRRLTPLLKLTSELAGQVVLVGAFDGPLDEAATLLKPLLHTGHPQTVELHVVPYIEAIDYFAGVKPSAPHFVAQGLPRTDGQDREAFKNTSAYQTQLFSRDAIDTMIAHLRIAENPASLVQFDAMGGAVRDVQDLATAFAHRDARASLQFQTYWTDPARAGPSRQWVESFRRAMLPYTSGAYVNYMDGCIRHWPTFYYGENLPRLLAVKQQIDPERVFNFPQGLAELLEPDRSPIQDA